MPNTYTQLAADDFQRADENPLSDGGNWSAQSGFPCQVASNVAEPVNSTGSTPYGTAIYTGIDWPTGQYTKVTIGSLAITGIVILRVLTNSDFSQSYQANVSNGSTTIPVYRMLAGPTQIGTLTAPDMPAPGDIWLMERLPNGNINVYQNGVACTGTQVNDNDLTVGSPGFDLDCGALGALSATTCSAWSGGMVNVGGFLGSIEAIQGATGGQVNSTTGASGGASSLNTIGATFLVAIVRAFNATPTMVDGESNTWDFGTVFNVGGREIAVASVNAPTTSTTHTFNPNASDGSAEIFAFSGPGPWTLDVEAGAALAQSGTSVVTDSITPAGDGEILVAGICSGVSLSAGTVNNGFSGGIAGDATDVALPQLLNGNPCAGMGGYLVDAADTAIDATFTTAQSNSDWVWVIAAFKSAPTFSVTGNVGVNSCPIAYTGPVSGSVTADGSGNYEIDGLTNGDYVITPDVVNGPFLPDHRDVTIDNADLTGVDFEPVFNISGNAGVADALVTWTGTSSGSTMADGSGDYITPTTLINGAYTVTPSLAGFVFTPTSQDIVIGGDNYPDVDFTATPAPPSGGGSGMGFDFRFRF